MAQPTVDVQNDLWSERVDTDLVGATVTALVPPTMREARDRHARLAAAACDDAEVRAGNQRRRGKLSARQRIDLVVDAGSFRELEGMRRGEENSPEGQGDGVMTGHATIHERKVVLFAQDFTVRGGSFGRAHANKVLRLLQIAERTGCPVVGLYDGGGARIDEGALALDGCGAMFEQIVRLSGVVPQISVVLGPCAGAAAYAPALTDVVFMVRDVGMMYLTGPDVVEKVTGERTDGQSLGGADVHAEASGVATFVHDDEASCLDDVRYLVSLLPSERGAGPSRLQTDDPIDRSIEELLDIVPSAPELPYDVLAVVGQVLDLDTFIEFHAAWAPNVVCGLGRLDGWVVGVVANQPLVRAGALDIAASEKAARFVSWCDAFSIPIITLVDVPGFMPGRDLERNGIIRHGAKLLHAYCAATVPRLQVILRKAYGGAYIVMDSPSTGNDLSYAWPTNELAVMGAESAVEIIHRRQIAGAKDPDAARRSFRSAYRAAHMHPYSAAHSGLVQEVIDPTATRVRLAEGLSLLETKTLPLPTRKHANVPY